MEQAPESISRILERAWIEINGNKSYDLQVHNTNLYSRILAQWSLGLWEAYIDGRRDCEQLDEFFNKVLRAGAYDDLHINFQVIWDTIKATFLNLQNRSRARENVSSHYDLDAEFYMSFLDPYNQYTCGYFKDTTDLNKAQEQKLDLQCRKLQLKPQDKVLDIGCWWGWFSKYAAQHYGCHVTWISISKEQIAYAQEYTKGLPVDIKFCDYRDLEWTYDKVLICGMIEHVGPKNYREIMEVVNSVLADDGLFLLHTIAWKESQKNIDPWIDRYIFPWAVLPSASQISKAFEWLFTMEDWHNIGQYYDPTLMARWHNFESQIEDIRNSYGERFIRVWKYYFLSCAGSFRSRMNQLYQIVFSKYGRVGGYQSVR